MRDGGEETRRVPVTGRRRVAGALRRERPEVAEDGRQRLKRKRVKEKGGDESEGERRTEESSGSDTGDESGRKGGKKKKRRQERDKSQQVLVSQLTIPSVQESNAGVYKCVAKSVVGEDSSEATIRVVPPIDPHPFVDKCPYAGYCLNGGTCMMFKIVGELVCQCAEGFKGQRCQEKEVYPTFSRNCQGPLRHLRHSRGLRCPRNQPTALWELLQQSLAHKQKVSPWTKPHLLSWSPTHTGHAYWPRYTRPAPHSSKPHQTAGPHNPAVTRGNLLPTASVLPQNPSSSDHLPAHHTTQDPFLLDSHLSALDLPQLPRRRDRTGHHRVLPSNPLGTRQPHPQQPYPDHHQLPTTRSQLKRRVGPDSFENPHVVRHPQSPALQSETRKEGERVQPTNPHSRTRHGHRHQQHLPEERDSHAHSSSREGQTNEPAKSSWDQKVSEAGLSWSSSLDSNTPTPPLFFTTPHQENRRQ
ncbi:uncharacterized protein LOC125028545 isoform X1 [Penaeus chinensis]|uniref:uncharacterized protein LOC125028545 isoform X1 n=1 Tax=Penaeus chinensis TaxID=139456 RepID=UPI001FB7032F|nr:uncharacterized protein LOC125028545 isoform X1 [Penaeus chinensis]